MFWEFEKTTANCLNSRQNPGKILVKELYLFFHRYLLGICPNFRYTISLEQLSLWLLWLLADVFSCILSVAKNLCTIRIKLFEKLLTIRYFNKLLYSFLTISFVLTMISGSIHKCQTFVYIRWFVYTRLHSSTFPYTRLHSSSYSSTFVNTRLVTRLWF